MRSAVSGKPTNALFCVFSLYVNAADCRFQKTDAGAVTCGFQHKGLFLDADNLADDSADGGDFISNLEIVAHFVYLFFLLFLGTNARKVKDCDDHNDHTDCQPDIAGAGE